jgi:fructokinase
MILCCGEALIDMLPRETAAGEAAFAPYVGGAVFNTAIALGRLGAPVSFFSGISRDLFGARLSDALSASDVALDHVRYSDRPTTLAFVHLREGQATYTFYDENTAGRMLTAEDLPVLGAEVAALHFSCISLIPEPCGSTYEALMRREHGRRVLMLDPNIRPGFIQDRAAHMARMRRMIAMADIVKLSDEDLAWFGEAGSPDEIAREWLGRGPKLVVITRGGQGAIGFTASDRVEVPARKVTVADTVGAGDTFNAGLLAHLHESGLLQRASLAALSRDQVGQALGFAMAAAAVTVSRPGANPPWRHEIDIG